MEIKISSDLKNLCKCFNNKLFVVGGFVRNSLLGLPIDDVDICSDIKVEHLHELLKGSGFEVKIKSKTLGTAIISKDEQKYEYSCFRKEEYSDNGEHSPIAVEFITSPEEDAKRRDFTINAIYYDISRDELLDFYNGIEDLKQKVIRAVETPEYVLSKDGVRILRLFRFQAELGFKIDKDTLLTAIKYSSNISALSDDRKLSEMVKLLHSSTRYPGHSKNNAFMKPFKLFNKYNLWHCFGIDEPKLKLNMVKKVEHKTQGFLIDLVDTTNPISISYFLEHFLTESGVNKKIMANLINILSGYYDALNGLENKSYFFKYFENFATIYKLLIHKSRTLANKYDFFYRYIIRHKLVIQVKDLKINGDDIKKFAPKVEAKRYKAILESLLSDVFDGKLQNTKEDLLSALDSKLKYL